MFMKDKYTILNNIEEYEKFILIIHSYGIYSYNYLNWLKLKNFLEFPLYVYGDNKRSVDIISNRDFIDMYNLSYISFDNILKF